MEVLRIVLDWMAKSSPKHRLYIGYLHRGDEKIAET